MGYDESMHIRHKNGQDLVNAYGWHLEAHSNIGRTLEELTNNFFKTIKSKVEWNCWDFWDDTPPEPEYADKWTKIDDGTVPIWSSNGPGWAGGLFLHTPKAIEAFLKANDYNDISPNDVECIQVSWDA